MPLVVPAAALALHVPVATALAAPAVVAEAPVSEIVMLVARRAAPAVPRLVETGTDVMTGLVELEAPEALVPPVAPVGP